MTNVIWAENVHQRCDLCIFPIFVQIHNQKYTNMKTASTILFTCCLLLLISGFQLIKTSLNITVRDETGNTVEGATVQLFETEEDYNTEKNVVAEGVTDKKGFLKLRELKPIAYYVIVRKDDKDNTGGGEQTGKLEEKKINKVTIIIQ